MRQMRYVLLALAIAVPAPATAQFSSDLPGVPRAAVPFSGSRQKRGEFDFLYFRVPRKMSGTDSLAFGMRIGLGRSYRIQSKWEAGFDLSLVEGLHLRESGVDSASTASPSFPNYTRGLLGFGIRVGVKYTPITSVTPEGYGYHAAIGVAFQPSLQPLFGVALEDDTTQTGGAFIDDENGSDGVLRALPRSIQVAAMGSYRSQRLQADGALVLERMPTESPSDPFPVTRVSTVSLNLGVKYRLTRKFAPGLVFWGAGAAPWRDRIIARGPNEGDSQWGVVFSFGSRPEAGTDLMIMSPRGSFNDAIRVYIRTRSTS